MCPFEAGEFTRDVRALVAENDRVPKQREPDHRPIEPAGAVIEIEGGLRFVSNGYVWVACLSGPNFRGISPVEMNRRTWWVESVADERIAR